MSDEIQAPDPRPGYYYVSVVDGGRSARLRGPFVDDHAGALAAVDEAQRDLSLVNPWAAFLAFGTCRSEVDAGPGFLDDEEKHALHDVELRCTSCRREKLATAGRFDPVCSCGGAFVVVVEHDHVLTHAEAVALGYGIRPVHAVNGGREKMAT